MTGSLIAIEDASDPRLSVFRLNERRLANRADKRDDDGAGLFLAEGDLVVERGVSAGCVPYLGLADGSRMPSVAERLLAAGADVYVGGERVRQMVTGLGMPHSIVALFHRPARPSPGELVGRCRRLVVVEGVDNPSNIGGIVRNAAGFGWNGLLLDNTSADPLHRRALRVAMGTAFDVPHARTNHLLDELRLAEHLQLIALTPSASAIDIGAVPAAERRAVLIGSERAGLSDELMSIATPVRIPIAPGIDSLNAAAAAAIACYALA